jgi:hypothetical protein
VRWGGILTVHPGGILFRAAQVAIQVPIARMGYDAIEGDRAREAEGGPGLRSRKFR